jgi:hypothetical protein
MIWAGTHYLPEGVDLAADFVIVEGYDGPQP